MLARLLLVLLVVSHGIPWGAVADAGHCSRCPAGAVAEDSAHCPLKKPAPGDHCKRPPTHDHARPSDGPAFHGAACSCGHGSLTRLAHGDPLFRPVRFALSVDDLAAAAEPSAPAILVEAAADPPSPPPRPLRS